MIEGRHRSPMTKITYTSTSTQLSVADIHKVTINTTQTLQSATSKIDASMVVSYIMLMCLFIYLVYQLIIF
jgi:hypothetical protein